MITLYHGKTQLAIVNILSFIVKVLLGVEFLLSRRLHPGQGKHSAWQSTAQNRAEARTHHPQRNSAQKPSSGRKGDRDSGGRSLRNFKFARFIVTHSPSVACGDSSLPEGAFVVSNAKTPPKIILGGVRVFSAKNAETTERLFYYPINKCFFS